MGNCFARKIPLGMRKVLLALADCFRNSIPDENFTLFSPRLALTNATQWND